MTPQIQGAFFLALGRNFLSAGITCFEELGVNMCFGSSPRAPILTDFAPPVYLSSDHHRTKESTSNTNK